MGDLEALNRSSGSMRRYGECVLTEAAIRSALLARIESRWGDDDHSIVVEELGTHFGSGRIDVAVVNGSLRGYEIKSATDRLDRLPGQAARYNEVFDYVTIVVATRHLRGCMKIAPDWWGVEEAHDRPGGSVGLRTVRRGRRNRRPERVAVANLLWRDELLAALMAIGRDVGLRSATREQLASALAGALPTRELGVAVRDGIRARPAWRGDPARTPSAETSRLAHRSSAFLARRSRPLRG